MSGLVIPNEHDLSKVGKRIQALPSALGGDLDAWDRIVVREFDQGKWWIPLTGYLSPMIPILLKLAVPQGDFLPVLAKIDAERWLLCMRKWLVDGEHKRIRKELGDKVGFYSWRNKADVGTAIQRCSGHYQLALKIWVRDAWCWPEKKD